MYVLYRHQAVVFGTCDFLFDINIKSRSSEIRDTSFRKWLETSDSSSRLFIPFSAPTSSLKCLLVSFQSVLSQHRRVRAAFAGAGRCIVSLENEGASRLKKRKKRRLQSASFVVRGQEEACQAPELITSIFFFSSSCKHEARAVRHCRVQRSVCWSASLHVCTYTCVYHVYISVLHVFPMMPCLRVLL